MPVGHDYRVEVLLNRVAPLNQRALWSAFVLTMPCSGAGSASLLLFVTQDPFFTLSLLRIPGPGDKVDHQPQMWMVHGRLWALGSPGEESVIEKSVLLGRGWG